MSGQSALLDAVLLQVDRDAINRLLAMCVAEVRHLCPLQADQYLAPITDFPFHTGIKLYYILASIVYLPAIRDHVRDTCAPGVFTPLWYILRDSFHLYVNRESAFEHRAKCTGDEVFRDYEHLVTRMQLNYALHFDYGGQWGAQRHADTPQSLPAER
jgi:hypothetical protein